MSNSDEEDEVCYAPWNFSWVVDGALAAMACPRSSGNMKYVAKQGIKHLVTLSPECRPAIYATPEVEWTEIGVEEFEAPTIQQIKKFIEVCQRCQIKNQPVGIHCRHGRGRTGVMAACYLVQFHDLAPERAIINLRLKRPGSVETPEQERIVVQYHDCIRGIKGTF